jgi:hypothetical protein
VNGKGFFSLFLGVYIGLEFFHGDLKLTLVAEITGCEEFAYFKIYFMVFA